MDSNNIADESIAVVNECIEHLQKLIKLRAGGTTNAVAASTRTLLQVLCSQEKAMKHFTSVTTGGIPLLASILDFTQDQHVRQMTIMIINEMLLRRSARNERAALLASSGTVNPLLKLVVKTQQPHSYSDEYVSCLCSAAAKVGKKDKKFAMKARLLGVLPVIVNHMRHYAFKPKVLNCVLMLLKRVLVSAVNAIQLTKADLVHYLLGFLDQPRKRMTLSVMYCLEAISLATRSRYAARQFVKKEIVDHLLQVFAPNNFSPGTSRVRFNRMLRSFNAVLHTMLHMTQIKAGREFLCSAGTVNALINWCHSIADSPGNHWDRMVLRASTVLQRCLPPRPLPLAKFNSPVIFNLPEQKADEPVDYSEAKNNDVSDSDSQISSNSSSFESGDTDQESDPFSEQGGLNTGECARQYRAFFEELKEDKEGKSLQECVRVEEPLVFLSHEPNFPHQSPSTESESIDGEQKPDLFFPYLNGENKVEDKNFLDHSYRCRGRTKLSEDRIHQSSSADQLQYSSLESSPSRIISCINISTKSDKKCIFTSSEVRSLLDSAKEEKRSQEYLDNVDTPKLYHSFASRTVSALPFVKTAYPDTRSCINCEEPLVKFYCPQATLMRRQIIKHMEEMCNREMVYKEIYNLDSLICESAFSNTALSNCDEGRIKCDKIPEHLLFESRFESGNLRKVLWKGGNEYDLILNPDVNSKSHHQWFYFEVSGMKANLPYVFNVINMEKSTSLFNNGMCPVMFSVRNHLENERGWTRTGSEISYFRNHYILGTSMMSSLRDKPYYTLSFTITFAYNNDVCYFAYHYPYTYTSLQTQMDCWLSSYDSTAVYCKKDELCKTLAGNSVPLLTITAKPIEASRPYIFLTARVHPGESNSSWVMKGTLNFLFSRKPSAHRLREMFIFKVIPMLNPDGVINGCHRCSLSGQDLNRQWITPNAKLHPTIFGAKNLLYYMNSLGKKPLVFCDYHGHSRRHNVFLYGCNPEQSWWTSDESKADCESFKIIPLLMHHMVPTFGLDHCCFNIERSREPTARVTVWRQFDVPLSYTMECTYGGCDQGLYAGYHIGVSQLEETGTKLCQCFGKIVPNFHKSNIITCTIPIDTSMLSKLRTVKPQMEEHADSFSSSLSEDELVEYEDGDQLK